MTKNGKSVDGKPKGKLRNTTMAIETSFKLCIHRHCTSEQWCGGDFVKKESKKPLAITK